MKEYLHNPIAEYALFLNGNKPRFLEIIGILQDGIIYCGNQAIELFKAGEFDDVVSKERAHFMSALDLGHSWDNLAKQEICITLEKV